MDTSTSQYLSLACSIAIRRFTTAQLVKDVPDWFWEDVLFVTLAKEHQLTDIFVEVQKGLPDAESFLFRLFSRLNFPFLSRFNFPFLSRFQFAFGLPRIAFNKFWTANSRKQEEQVERISCYIISKKSKSEMIDKSKRAKFDESFRIALETTFPLDEKEAQLIKKAKEAVASSDDPTGSEDAVYEIDKFSPLYSETDLRKPVLDSLAGYEKTFATNGNVSWGKEIGVQDSYISIIREACANGRFEAALNLALAQTEENNTSLLGSGVVKLEDAVLKMLLSYPAAVEKEYVRAKTRFANFENCQAKLPNFMNLYSICFQLRCERTKLVRLVDHLPQQYRDAFEEDLIMLDNALGISYVSIMRTAFFICLKKEHFNNVQKARIELLEGWVKDNPAEVGLALAHRAIYSAVYLSSLSKELENICSLLEPFGAKEECLLSQARKVMPAAKSEVASCLKVTMTKIPTDPAPAA